MTVGSPESLTLHLAVLIVGIFVWWALLRFFRIKSLALAFALGYATLVVFAVAKGWRPMDPGGFNRLASEAVFLTWPSTLLVKVLKQDLRFIIIISGMLQYCAIGWVIEIFLSSVFGDK